MTLSETVAKIQAYKKPNSANALALLEQLDVDSFDGLQDSLDLLEEYTDLDRTDFDDAEEYADARAEAWDAFVDSLDDIEENKEESNEAPVAQPTVLATKTLAQAMIAVSQAIPVADKTISDRLNRGYDIVRTLGEGYSVTKKSDGMYSIHKESTASIFSQDSSANYTTSSKTCTCPDFEKARAGLCKHRLAVMLLEEMSSDKR